jgi:hypothetical protein
MLRLDAALARPVAHNDGLATRKQLRQLGLTDEAIDVRIEAGIFQIIHPGVFHHAATPFTERTRLRAAILAAGEGAVASHRSAAMLHGFEGVRRFRPEILIPGTRLPRLEGVTIHRTRLLPASDITVVQGIPATAKGRTMLGLGAVLPYEIFESVVHTALVTNRVQVGELIACVERVGRRGRDGTANLRALLEGELPDERLQSILERDLLRLIVRGGVLRPVLQHPVVLEDGTVLFLDFAWPDLMLAVEADGHRWHATPKKLEADAARSRALQRLGWAHHRYGWNDVHSRALATITELQALVPRSVSR